MRIGIDARLLSEPLTGIGRYSYEIIRALITHKQHDFYIYSPQPFSMEQYDHVTYRHEGFQGRLSRLFWAQTYLPFWAHKDKLDVFWGTTHRLAPFLPQSCAKVVTIHDLVYLYAPETMRPSSFFAEKLLLPQAIKRADYILADSKNTAQNINVHFPRQDIKIATVYPAASQMPAPLPFSNLSTLGISSTYFLFVGTLEPRKNLARLLEAYGRLSAHDKAKAKLVIAGGKGWGNVHIDELISKFNLQDDVILTGYVSEEALATLYAHALFLAMPSLYEGFGLPIIESFSFGVPALTSHCSSMPEVGGDAAILVDPFNVDEIKKGIITLLDKSQRQRLAQKTHDQLIQFSWKKAANQLINIFEDLELQ